MSQLSQLNYCSLDVCELDHTGSEGFFPQMVMFCCYPIQFVCSNFHILPETSVNVAYVIVVWDKTTLCCSIYCNALSQDFQLQTVVFIFWVSRDILKSKSGSVQF